jgi:pSer/pThr/pTyr-binding forkhead associated (FHA) protein
MVHNVAKMKRPVIIVQLIHIHGPLKGEIQEYLTDTVSIGRNPSNDLCFPADLTIVSRKHAEIVREGNQFRLISQGANGTFVNGKKVTEVFLKDGDVLEFADGGPKVSFLTQMKEGVEMEPPPQQKPQIPPTPAAIEKPFAQNPSLEVQAAVVPPLQKPHVELPPDEEAVYIPPTPTPEPPRPRPSAPAEQPLDIIPTTAAPLIIQYGPTIRSYKELPVTLGRHLRCGFVLDHPGILDQHAQIFYLAGQYWVKDLTGQKMVQVNYQPIPFQAPLALDDMVVLGPQGPTFRFIGEGRLAEVAQAQPEAAPGGMGIQGADAKPDGAGDKSSKGVFSRLKKKLF